MRFLGQSTPKQTSGRAGSPPYNHDCLVVLLLARRCETSVIDGLDVLRVEPDSLGIIGDGFVELAPGLPGIAPMVEGRGVIGLEPDGPNKIGQHLVIVHLRHQVDAVDVQFPSIPAVRRRYRRAEIDESFVNVIELDERTRTRIKRGG